LNNHLTLSGATLTVQPAPDTFDISQLYLASSTTIDGTGTVVLESTIAALTARSSVPPAR